MPEWNDWMKLHGHPQHHWYEWRTVTTTTSIEPDTLDAAVRKIVREELADIMPIDVPDAPPEDLA